MIIIIYIYSFLLGLVVGSFLNSLVYRLYSRQTILGRSFCPLCRKQISWFDNISVISFIILHGRCRNCQQKISWQYPLVELITGLLFLAAAVRLNPADSQYALLLMRDWLMIFTMIFVCVYDLKYYAIEDVVVLPMAAAVLIINLFLKFSWINLVLSGIGSALFFLFQYCLSRGKGIGFGDFRIGILLGLYFGWPKIVLAIFLSYMIGSIISLALVILRQKKMTSMVPLGPFLSIGALITIFYGQNILVWYLSFLK
jgi:prepilin signal peptidase PulO-like enzyme (type II secretory pathway)